MMNKDRRTVGGARGFYAHGLWALLALLVVASVGCHSYETYVTNKVGTPPVRTTAPLFVMPFLDGSGLETFQSTVGGSSYRVVTTWRDKLWLAKKQQLERLDDGLAGALAPDGVKSSSALKNAQGATVLIAQPAFVGYVRLEETQSCQMWSIGFGMLCPALCLYPAFVPYSVTERLSFIVTVYAANAEDVRQHIQDRPTSRLPVLSPAMPRQVVVKRAFDVDLVTNSGYFTSVDHEELSAKLIDETLSKALRGHVLNALNDALKRGVPTRDVLDDK